MYFALHDTFFCSLILLDAYIRLNAVMESHGVLFGFRVVPSFCYLLGHVLLSTSQSAPWARQRSQPQALEIERLRTLSVPGCSVQEQNNMPLLHISWHLAMVFIQASLMTKQYMRLTSYHGPWMIQCGLMHAACFHCVSHCWQTVLGNYILNVASMLSHRRVNNPLIHF